MIENSKTKDMRNVNSEKVVDTKVKEISQNEYFFSGSTKYYSVTIHAKSYEEAVEIWKEKRVSTEK